MRTEAGYRQARGRAVGYSGSCIRAVGFLHVQQHAVLYYSHWSNGPYSVNLDTEAVLYGEGWPQNERPHGEEFLLAGACYVHDIMDEALHVEVQERTFHIS